ncbi:MAG: hypothetical protein IT441_03055 [Phycisphaeraceae bacterium]|nr:hypothetical protein [Phycisphaeraceae bacterium]
MRLLLNTLIALMFAALTAAAVWDHYHRNSGQTRIDQTRQALAVLQDKTVYHAAMARARYEEQVADANADGVDPPKPRPAPMILPEWFGSHIPVNALAPAGQPWIDLAPEGDISDQPPDPILSQNHQAGFWYNPTLRLFRARVPDQGSDKANLDLYNKINGCDLDELAASNDLARRPQPYAPPSAIAAANLPPVNYTSDIPVTVTDAGPMPVAPLRSVSPANSLPVAVPSPLPVSPVQSADPVAEAPTSDSETPADSPSPEPPRKRSLLTHRPRN